MKNEKRKCCDWKIICFALFAAVFVLAAAMLLHNKLTDERENNAFIDLAAMTVQTADAPTPVPAPALDKTDEPEPELEPVMLAQYKALYGMNPDMYGWIKIDGTVIDYPVMWTPDDPEHYLKRAFDGTSSKSGCLFIGEGFEPGAVNTIIYGHNMKSGAMFADLLKFEDKAFYSLHPTFSFNTLNEENEYEIIAAFRSRVYYEDETDVFRYYQYYDIQTEDEFYEFVDSAKAASAYDTGVSARWGDELVTLSTCAYHTSDGRFVVVAKKIRPIDTVEK